MTTTQPPLPYNTPAPGGYPAGTFLGQYLPGDPATAVEALISAFTERFGFAPKVVCTPQGTAPLTVEGVVVSPRQANSKHVYWAGMEQPAR